MRFWWGILYLSNSKIESLGNLESVGSNLYLRKTPVESLGNLKSVGGGLNLADSKITSLGNLRLVGGGLDLENTPVGKRLKSEMSEDDIKNKFGVKGELYL
jgi:hypothetical protein